MLSSSTCVLIDWWIEGVIHWPTLLVFVQQETFYVFWNKETNTCYPAVESSLSAARLEPVTPIVMQNAVRGNVIPHPDSRSHFFRVIISLLDAQQPSNKSAQWGCSVPGWMNFIMSHFQETKGNVQTAWCGRSWLPGGSVLSAGSNW